MKLTPKTEEELDNENLLPEGIYDFEVFRAEDKVSAKGNEMIALGLRIFAPNGGTPFVNDYILEAFGHKLRHFCDEVGLMDLYNRGSLSAADCHGRTGKVFLEIEKANGKYAAKNSVRDYGVREQSDEAPKTTKGANAKGSTKSEPTEDDSEIPF